MVPIKRMGVHFPVQIGVVTLIRRVTERLLKTRPRVKDTTLYISVEVGLCLYACVGVIKKYGLIYVI